MSFSDPFANIIAPLPLGEAFFKVLWHLFGKLRWAGLVLVVAAQVPVFKR